MNDLTSIDEDEIPMMFISVKHGSNGQSRCIQVMQLNWCLQYFRAKNFKVFGGIVGLARNASPDWTGQPGSSTGYIHISAECTDSDYVQLCVAE